MPASTRCVQPNAAGSGIHRPADRSSQSSSRSCLTNRLAPATDNIDPTKVEEGGFCAKVPSAHLPSLGRSPRPLNHITLVCQVRVKSTLARLFCVAKSSQFRREGYNRAARPDFISPRRSTRTTTTTLARVAGLTRVRRMNIRRGPGTLYETGSTAEPGARFDIAAKRRRAGWNQDHFLKVLQTQDAIALTFCPPDLLRACNAVLYCSTATRDSLSAPSFFLFTAQCCGPLSNCGF